MVQATPNDIQRATREDEGVRGVMSDPARGVIGDPVTDMYMQQLADPSINKPVEPFQSVPTFDLGLTGEYKFISKPGFRLVALNIPVPEYTDDEKWAEKQEKIYERRFRGRADQLDFNLQVVDELGETIIKFKPLPGKFQCTYDTSSDLVARYIRGSQEFAEGRITEIQPPMTVRIDGVDVEVVPANQEARLNLAKALGQNGS